jgi:hypothetical protein
MSVEDRKKPLFPLGQVVGTPGALEALEQANKGPLDVLSRHVTGDWGDLEEEDKTENDLGVTKMSWKSGNSLVKYVCQKYLEGEIHNDFQPTNHYTRYTPRVRNVA